MILLYEEFAYPAVNEKEQHKLNLEYKTYSVTSKFLGGKYICWC